MKRLSAKISEGYRWIVQPLLVLFVIVFGFLGARGLSSQGTPPKRVEDRTYAPLVRVLTSEVSSTPARIETYSTLQARTQVPLVPQVGGRVVSIHPGFRSGGTFLAGEVLLRIEPRDFELRVAGARADVSSAETALSTLSAEAEAAREEWRLLNGDAPVPTLVGKEPQLLEAQARIAAAKATLESAQLSLERTELSLPWNGRIIQAMVDVGAVVNANQSIGSAYATDVFELSTSLRQDQLQWVRLPGEKAPHDSNAEGPQGLSVLVEYPGADAGTIESEIIEPLEWAIRAVEGLSSMEGTASAGQGWVTVQTTGEFEPTQTVDRIQESLETVQDFPPSGASEVQFLWGAPPTRVLIEADLSGQLVSLPGRVVRTAGELDSMSRFAKVVLEVDLSSIDPTLRNRMLPGTFARVKLEGMQLTGVSSIPRAALREQGIVWTVAEDRIAFQKPEVVYQEEDLVWLRGLPGGTQVVTSDLDVITEGMQVRTIAEGQLTKSATDSASAQTSEGQGVKQ